MSSLSSEGAPRAVWFWLLALMLGFFLFAASAPSPIYPIYQRLWHFSSITLTAIYSVYALGALVALLVTGRLSDHVGRRRIVIVALMIQIAGIGAFLPADGIGALYVARVVQGVGTGVAAGAISAWLVDLQPPDSPGFGGFVTGVALIAGLGAGAVGAGLLVEYAPDPLHLVYWVLIIVFALALALTPFIPDSVEHTPGAMQSLRPQIGVPQAARTTFVALAPSLIATWALGGFYLSLGPLLAVSLLERDSRIAGGLVIGALMGAGATASALARKSDARVMVIRGSLVLIVGVSISLFAVAIGSTAGLYVGSVAAGLGFGPAFSGIIRSLTPLAPPAQRSALLASLYVLVYASFSVPTVLAGIAVAYFPLPGTTYIYGLVVITLAAVTTAAVWRGTSSSAIAP